MIKNIIISIFIIGLGFGIYYLTQTKQDADLKYSNCELGDLVGDDVERLPYQNYYVDYHTEDFTKSQIEDYAKTCLDDGIKNQYQMDCCVRMKMYPEN